MAHETVTDDVVLDECGARLCAVPVVALTTFASPGRVGSRVTAENFTDPENARLVLLAAGGLALVGLALLVGTVMWWRSAKVEHPSLAPLEVMSARKFSKAAQGEQRRMLDEVRPEGAQPAQAVRPEPIDLRTTPAAEDPNSFDDLLDAAVPVHPSLEEITKGLAKPAEPRIASIEAMLEAPLSAPLPVSNPAPIAVSSQVPFAPPSDGPIDPLLQRSDPGDR
jgi:hypothetical protein